MNAPTSGTDSSTVAAIHEAAHLCFHAGMMRTDLTLAYIDRRYPLGIAPTMHLRDRPPPRPRPRLIATGAATTSAPQRPALRVIEGGAS